MRKLLISLLLASAAASPALAGPRDQSDRDTARAERAEASRRARTSVAGRSERSQRAVQVERPQFTGQAQVDAANGGGSSSDSQHVQPNGGPDARALALRTEQAANSDDGDERSRPPRRAASAGRRTARSRWCRTAASAWTTRRCVIPTVRCHQSCAPRVPVVSDVPRPGTQPPARVDNRRGSDVRWSTDWRRDHRYDWRNWRDRNRSPLPHRLLLSIRSAGAISLIRIGWRLWPNYYSSNYWINDPWQYRLPYAPPGTRWVRYYNDALLVDMYTGEVVDVIHDFFW